MRILRPLLPMTAFLLAAAALPAQSTCVCTADYIGTLGGSPRSQVNPAWSTCAGACTVFQAQLPDIRNTQTLRANMNRSWSLPEQEYTLWARDMERLRRERAAELRAASLPRRSANPLEATLTDLSTDGRTATGAYRLRIEKGEMVLRGEVPTLWVRDQALEIAEGVAGMPVRNELRVTSLGTVTDEQLTTEVERVLAGSGGDVSVDRGVVTTSSRLTPDQEDRVHQVPGVRALRGAVPLPRK